MAGAVGFAALGVALSDAMHEAAHTLFVAHMAQHLLLTSLAAPALLLADPFPVTLWGLPLLHIAYGLDLKTGKPRVASGIIAIGNIAKGVVALGGAAFGGLAFGGLSIGLLSVGGIAAGLVALGGGAVALLLAFGGAAVAPVALGGGAVGWFALGGGGWGVHAISGNVKASSPDKTRNPSGRRRKISIICVRFPDASFIATMFSQSLAKRSTVDAAIFDDVRPGTL